MDALTGQDLSRWFPLSSPSDYLYFLPARRGADTAKKLRLISSATGLLNPLHPDGHTVEDFRTNIVSPDRTDTASYREGSATVMGGYRTATAGFQQQTRPLCIRSRAFRDGRISDGGAIRTVSARSTDHYRAIPLSDGYHILFTDPRSGCLCLGTDAPVGSVTRLLRKVWFRPPPAAISPIPILYAAGSDTRHGVRVVGTFAAASSSGSTDDDMEPPKQMIAFFTVPPDLFHDLSHGNAMLQLKTDILNDRAHRQSTSEPWLPDQSYQAIDVFCEPFRNTPSYPLEICGQAIAVCDNLTEIALESSPEMVVWAFSSSGWAKAWAIDSGGFEAPLQTAIQQDGGVRLIDQDGDVIMAGDNDHMGFGELDSPEVSPLIPTSLNPFDGTVGTSLVERRSPLERASWCTRSRGSDRMSETASVDRIEEVNGIVRLDVQLR